MLWWPVPPIICLPASRRASALLSVVQVVHHTPVNELRACTCRSDDAVVPCRQTGGETAGGDSPARPPTGVPVASPLKEEPAVPVPPSVPEEVLPKRRVGRPPKKKRMFFGPRRSLLAEEEALKVRMQPTTQASESFRHVGMNKTVMSTARFHVARWGSWIPPRPAVCMCVPCVNPF